jgi:hypothetical protein
MATDGIVLFDFDSRPTTPDTQGEGNCYTHSPLFFPTMPWAMRYKPTHPTKGKYACSHMRDASFK